MLLSGDHCTYKCIPYQCVIVLTFLVFFSHYLKAVPDRINKLSIVLYRGVSESLLWLKISQNTALSIFGHCTGALRQPGQNWHLLFGGFTTVGAIEFLVLGACGSGTRCMEQTLLQ